MGGGAGIGGGGSQPDHNQRATRSRAGRPRTATRDATDFGKTGRVDGGAVGAVPFQFLGRWQEAGEEVYFLAQGQQVHSLKPGDSVGPWRLEETAPAGLVFTYVPLNERRTLRLTP